MLLCKVNPVAPVRVKTRYCDILLDDAFAPSRRGSATTFRPLHLDLVTFRVIHILQTFCADVHLPDVSLPLL